MIIPDCGMVFDPEKHTYTNKDGEKYTSCSTVAEAWDKSFFLGPWYAKECAEAIKEKFSIIIDAYMVAEEKALDSWVVGTNMSSVYEIIDYCKSAAVRKSTIAKAIGRKAHEKIHEHLNGHEIQPSWEPEVYNAVSAFEKWLEGVDIEWVASELQVASHEHKVAGTLDALALIDGTLTLVDFKTSSQLSASYLSQCAGYDLMLREMGIFVEQYLVLRIPKDGNPVEELWVKDLIQKEKLVHAFILQKECLAIHKETERYVNESLRANKRTR